MNTLTSQLGTSTMRTLEMNEASLVGGGPLVVPAVVIAVVAGLTIGNAAYEFGKGMVDGYNQQMGK